MKVRKVGNSLGIILPKDIVENLNIVEGTDLYPIRTANGVALTIHDPEFEKVMQAFEIIDKKYKNVFKALAQC